LRARPFIYIFSMPTVVIFKYVFSKVLQLNYLLILSSGSNTVFFRVFLFGVFILWWFQKSKLNSCIWLSTVGKGCKSFWKHQKIQEYWFYFLLNVVSCTSNRQKCNKVQLHGWFKKSMFNIYSANYFTLY